MDKRAQKRWKRENRKDKGVSTAALIAKRNDEVRKARRTMGCTPDSALGSDLPMLMLAAGLMGRR